MSTLHKFKAYFGMAPMDDYEDEYYDDRASSRGFRAQPAPRMDDTYGRFDGREYEDVREPEYAPMSSYRGGYAEEPAFRAREFDRPDMGRPRSFLRGASTRGALAMDPRRMTSVFEDGHPLSKITTLRPKDYSEARTIGERFRDGTPVIMDLVSMDNADAKRLVDFAAGLAFALRGSFDKVATKVFLLSPADVDVSPEERRRIAETGFYAYR